MLQMQNSKDQREHILHTHPLQLQGSNTALQSNMQNSQPVFADVLTSH